MTTSQSDFQLNRPGALIAALPAVLGFVSDHTGLSATHDISVDNEKHHA
jgi:hypothetical protein